MRKLVILTMAGLLSCPMIINGQRIRLGVESGLQLSTFSHAGNIYDNNHIRTGFGGGFTCNYTFSGSFGLQTGLIYEQKGFRGKNLLADETYKMAGSFNYLSLPVMAEKTVPLSGPVKMYFDGGLYISYKTYTEKGIADFCSEFADEHTDKILNSDFGWLFGCGVQWPSGNNIIRTGFRYSQGLATVTDADPDSRNKSLWIGLAYVF